MEIVGGDPGRRLCDATHDGVVVWPHVEELAPPHVKQDEPWLATPWQQTASRRDAVDPQLQRVRLDERRVKGGVRLEVDQRYLSVDLTHAVDDTADSSAPNVHVEAGLDREGAGAGERMTHVPFEHLAARLRTAVNREQVATNHVPGREGFMHRSAELRGAHRADVSRL